MIGKLVPTWCWLAAIGALVVALGAQQVRVSNAKADRAAAEQELADDRTRYAQLAQAAEAEHRRVEMAWQDHAATATARKDDEIKALNARADAMAGELRKRPARPVASSGAAPAVTGSCPSGTGAGLYRDDGEFLGWLAAAAARIAKERDYCYARYNEARDTP